MKRILKALSAFSLSLVFILTLGATPAGAAETALSDDVPTPYCGYLVMLRDPQPVLYADDLFVSATLMAAEDERDSLLELSGDWGIYKTGDLSQIQNLVYSGQVDMVEPDYQAELFDVVPTDPDDPYFTSHQQKNLTGRPYGIQVRAAWEAGLTGQGVTVAVIDSGLSDTHEDAPTKIGRGRYFYYQKEAGEIPGKTSLLTVNGEQGYYTYWNSGNYGDNLGHGTMVAGIIAANANNALGIAGIAPDVTILPIRCFTATPGHAGGFTSNLISGLDYAVANGADIINMSWGVEQQSSLLRTAVDNAYKAGCILVAAAGNKGNVYAQYPAAWDNVISVGSVDQSGRLTSYSQRVTSVNICAPGGVSSDPIVSLDYDSDTSYLRKSGTSFSTPAVVGAAALLLQADPTLTQGDLLNLLAENSVPLTQDNDARYSGYGALDLQALLDAVGYTGCAAKRTADGFSVYAAHHPTAQSGQTSVLALVAGYNADHHLVESYTKTLSLSEYRNCAGSFDFSDPTIAEFRAYYLDPTTLSALHEPAIPVIS